MTFFFKTSDMTYMVWHHVQENIFKAVRVTHQSFVNNAGKCWLFPLGGEIDCSWVKEYMHKVQTWCANSQTIDFNQNWWKVVEIENKRSWNFFKPAIWILQETLSLIFGPRSILTTMMWSNLFKTPKPPIHDIRSKVIWTLIHSAYVQFSSAKCKRAYLEPSTLWTNLQLHSCLLKFDPITHNPNII